MAFEDFRSNSFCNHTFDEIMVCKCAENETGFAWVWSEQQQVGQAGHVILDDECRLVIFNPSYSCGTAAVRGQKLLTPSYHHFWELKMTSAVYGTDIMVGVGSKSFDIHYGVNVFCSLLGRDKESWGLSYAGNIQHDGLFKRYCSRWGKGSVIGVHYDPIKGTVEFYLNRKPMGVAFSGLRNKELYPVIASTSARSGMKLISSYSFPVKLSFLSAKVVFTQLCKKLRISPENLSLPPGLKNFVYNNYGAFFSSSGFLQDDFNTYSKLNENVVASSFKRNISDACDDETPIEISKRLKSQRVSSHHENSLGSLLSHQTSFFSLSGHQPCTCSSSIRNLVQFSGTHLSIRKDTNLGLSKGDSSLANSNKVINSRHGSHSINKAKFKSCIVDPDVINIDSNSEDDDN